MPQVFPSCVVATGGDDGSAPKNQNLYNKYKVGFYVVFVLLVVWLVARPAPAPATDKFGHHGYSYFARSPFTTSSDLQWGAVCDQGNGFNYCTRMPTGTACWSNPMCASNSCLGSSAVAQGVCA